MPSAVTSTITLRAANINVPGRHDEIGYRFHQISWCMRKEAWSGLTNAKVWIYVLAITRRQAGNRLPNRAVLVLPDAHLESSANDSFTSSAIVIKPQ